MSRTVPIIYCALAGAVLLVYSQVLGHDFVSFDDPLYVVANPWVRDGLSFASIQWAFSEFHAQNWHPLTWLSHMLDVQIFGLNAGPHLLTNALIHAASAMLFFACLRAMTGALWPSAIAAALFALHPLRVESVAWVSERKDVLGGFFFLLTLLAYTRYTALPTLRRYATVFGCLALGLMAKPMLVTLPFVLLLLDFWPFGRAPIAGISAAAGEHRPVPSPSNWGKLVAEKLPLLALSVLSCVITLMAQREVASSLEAVSLPLRLANAAISYVAYLGSAAWPSGLAFFYPHPAIQSAELGGGLLLRATLASLLLLALSALALRTLRSRPYLAVGWFWYVGMLVPVIGVLQVGVQARADRYTYLPMMGIAIALVWAGRDLANSRGVPRDALRIGLLALLCGVAVLSWQQVRTWRSEGSVFAHAIAVTEGNYVAHNGLGLLSQASGDTVAARRHYETALEIFPHYSDARTNLGNLYQRSGDFSGAEEQQRVAIAANSARPEAHNNLGVALSGQGRIAEAIEAFDQALQADPTFSAAHYNRAAVLEREGRMDEAAAGYRRAIELQSDYVDAICSLGVLLGKQGNLAEAKQMMQQGIAVNPSDARCHLNYAVALASENDLAGAMEALEEVLRIDPTHEQASRALDQMRRHVR